MQNKRLHFYIQCRPCTATAQERKSYCSAGRVIFYDPPNVKAMKQTLRAYLKPFVPEEPYCCLGQNLPGKDQKEIYQKVENKAIMEDK